MNNNLDNSGEISFSSLDNSKVRITYESTSSKTESIALIWPKEALSLCEDIQGFCRPEPKQEVQASGAVEKKSLK